MRTLRILLTLLMGALLFAAPPRRVVSHAVGTDDMVLAMADKGQIAALSALGRDPRYSPHHRDALQYPALSNGEAEAILRHRPDLVVLTSYSPVEVRTLLERAKVRIFMVEKYETFEDLCTTSLALGKVLGREAQAAALVASWRTRVEALRQRLAGVKPVRVMSAGIYPFVSGARTTFQDLCDHSGALNVAAEAGLVGIVPMPGEKPLQWKIDRLIGPSEANFDLPAKLKELSPYKFMPALKQGRLVQIDGALLATTSHRRLDTYEALAKALHPERFR